MPEETYHVVEHDGGWAYKVEGVFSETFPTHDDALQAARIAARRQQQADEADEGISYQDSEGEWHDEVAPGSDRPQTQVVEGD